MNVPRIGLVLVTTAGLLRGASWSCAEEPPLTPKLSDACRAGWLSFNIISGRINLVGTRFGNINTSATDSGRSERLIIHSKSSGPAVSYEMTNAKQRLLIELSAGNQLQVQWILLESPQRVLIEYRQTPGKSVSLKAGPDSKPLLVEAPSLWHLLIFYPELGRQYVVPLIHIFQTDLEPRLFVEELEGELLRSDFPLTAPNRQRWADWVRQLGDERFARRQAADKELRKAGRLVVTYLEQLDTAKLDAEQQYRVHRIIEALSESSGMDTPGAIAAWLGGDPTVWLALLERENPAVRRVAQQRLESLAGTPLSFDAEAAPEIRHQQVAQLRAQLQNR